MHKNHHGDDRKHQQCHPSEKSDVKERTRSGKRFDFAPWRPSQKKKDTDLQHSRHNEKPFRSMEAKKQNVFGREPTNVGEKDEHHLQEHELDTFYIGGNCSSVSACPAAPPCDHGLLGLGGVRFETPPGAQVVVD